VEFSTVKTFRMDNRSEASRSPTPLPEKRNLENFDSVANWPMSSAYPPIYM
jgi:hypothetical protein